MILGEILPTASTTTLLYYPTESGASGSLYFVNQSSILDSVRVAVNTNYSDTPTNVNYILYNAVVYPNYTVSIQEIYLGTNQGLFVYSENGTTNFTFIGEES